MQHVTSVAGDRRKAVADIDCLRFLNPQEAVMSGIVTENLNPALVGQTLIFRVYDDGEGGDAVDRQSGAIFRMVSTGVNCHNFANPDANVTPILGGNIQVRP